MSRTLDNLKEAFAGEAQANRRYLAYARQAQEEGLKQVSRLFRAAATAETVHAHAFLLTAGKLGDTSANLEAALEGELYEQGEMYPRMAREAEAEGRKTEAAYFDFAKQVEAQHAKLFRQALENPSALAETDYYVCKVCGYTSPGPCEACPICQSGAASFFKVED